MNLLVVTRNMWIVGTAVLLPACASEKVTEVVLASVSVLPYNAAVDVGATVKFEATVSDEGGAPIDGIIVAWSSSAPDIVFVDGTGLARALSFGVATVEASFRGVAGVATVVVLPPAGFTVRETNGGTVVREGATRDSITLELDATPRTNVTLSVSSEDPGEATVSPASLTFTPSSWSIPQTVVIEGIADFSVDGHQAVLIGVSIGGHPGSEYAGVEDQWVEILVLDDDVADFSVIESEGKTSAREGEEPDTITVALTARPSSNVVFVVSSDDPTDATVGPSRLTFTPGNWAAPQAVTFRAVDDGRRDGKQRRTVTIAVHDPSSNHAFHGLRKSITATTHDRKRSDERPHPRSRSAPQ